MFLWPKSLWEPPSRAHPPPFLPPGMASLALSFGLGAVPISTPSPPRQSISRFLQVLSMEKARLDGKPGEGRWKERKELDHFRCQDGRETDFQPEHKQVDPSVNQRPEDQSPSLVKSPMPGSFSQWFSFLFLDF